MARKKSDEPRAEVVRVTIRVPKTVHEALCRRRQETGQSLNDLLIEAAARLMGIPVPPMPKGIPGPKPRKR